MATCSGALWTRFSSSRRSAPVRMRSSACRISTFRAVESSSATSPSTPLSVLGLEHEDLNEASQEILDRIAPIAKESYGIEVVEAGIVEYTLPVENRPSVIQRMIAERARIAARYRSEGEERALRIEALAINEHEKLIADAHAEATTILGEAEAEAMAILGQAYKKDPEFYKFIRALDSYDRIIDRNTTLMLPADNELFKYLDSKARPR